MGALLCGPLEFRFPTAPLPKGAVVLGHKHNFPHPTVVISGSFKVRLLEPTKIDAYGKVLEANVISEVVVSAGDPRNMLLIEKGKYHSLESLEDGSRYMCMWPHRIAHAVSLEHPGERIDPPHTKRDEDGRLWAWVDETITEVHTGWRMGSI